MPRQRPFPGREFREEDVRHLTADLDMEPAGLRNIRDAGPADARRISSPAFSGSLKKMIES